MKRRVSFKPYYEDHMDWHRYRDLGAHFLYRETRRNYSYASAFAVSLMPKYAAEIKAKGGAVRVNSVFVPYIKIPKHIPKPFLYNVVEWRMTLQIDLAPYYSDHSDWHRWNTAAYKATLTRRVGLGPAPRTGGFYIIGHRTELEKRQWLGSVMVATSLETSPAGEPLPHAFRYKLIAES